METEDRESVAASLAGMHNLFALLVRRLTIEGSLDIAELLTDLDRLLEQPGQHSLTRAVESDARETLIGLLACGPHGEPVAIRQDELPSVAPVRRSSEFERCRT